MSSSPLAIFDLDYTLLEGDSEYLWAQFLFQQKMVDQAYLDGIATFYRQYEAGTLNNQAYAEFFLRPLTLLPMETFLALRKTYLEEIRPRLRPTMLEKVHWHQAQGHQVLLITATNDFIARPIGRMAGIAEMICTLAEVKDGRLTGRIGEQPPFREGKVYQLETWLKTKGLNLSNSWCYSDSYNDLPLLMLAGCPVAVTPDAKLRQYAIEHGWTMIDL